MRFWLLIVVKAFTIVNEANEEICFNYASTEPIYLLHDPLTGVKVKATKIEQNGKIVELEVRTMGDYRVVVNLTGIHPLAHHGTMFNLLREERHSNNYNLTAELLYGDMLIQKWKPLNSGDPVRLRLALEDGTHRTSARQRPQGAVFLISKSLSGHLEFGIEDPSGLSIRSIGLIGQFLGCIRFAIERKNDVGTLNWSNYFDRRGIAKMLLTGSCWSFVSSLDERDMITSCNQKL